MADPQTSEQPELETIQHPILGPLKFPKDMGPDERNQVIEGHLADIAAKRPSAEEPGILDEEIPLSGYGNATLSGLQSVGRGVRDFGRGVMSTFGPRKEGESVLGSIPAVRMAKGLYETGKQAMQVPGAIHDINQSPDPSGAYLQAAGRTAGESAGQLGAMAAADEMAGAVPTMVDYGVKVLGPKPALAPEMAARGMARAINPPVQEWPGHIEATQAEAGNIQEFAKRNQLPLKTQLDWAKAARGAADEAKNVFQNDVLKPHADDTVSVSGSEYRGKTVGEGQNAKLSDINKRITDINDELRPDYRKAQQGQTRTALASDADLKAEHGALTKILHEELGKRTGMSPEDIAGMRQRFGRQYTIADQTEAAANARASPAGKANEGRDLPTNKAGLVARGINKLRGGPEKIADKAFQKALGKTENITAKDLPKMNPPEASGIPRTPGWRIKERLGMPMGEEIPTMQSSEAEMAQPGERLAARRAAKARARDEINSRIAPPVEPYPPYRPPFIPPEAEEQPPYPKYRAPYLPPR